MKKSLAYFVCCILVIFFLTPTSVAATELVYTFVNPAFGGSPFNAAWMMNSAQSQNKLQEPREEWTMPETDPIEDFSKSLNRQILYNLSRKIVDSAFGEEGLTEGHYTMDTYTIDISTGLDGINVKLVDIETGNETIITVPFY